MKACEEDSAQVMSLSVFRGIWHTSFPHIVIQRPKTDLCATCQKNFHSLATLRTLEDSKKIELLQSSTRHLGEVSAERKAYQETVSRCTLLLKSHAEKDQLRERPSMSYDGVLHYSFDYAQQIHVPHSSQHVGPLYFLTPYKVALFGVACEPATKMVLYIVPECLATGKGANSVISYLHHFFEKHSYGEKEVHFRADNCTGQNKNRFMMSYLCHRVFAGLHRKITG